jgi:hypothetical protein
MALPSISALEPSDGARQQLRDPAERNSQHVADLAIAESVVTQMQTLTLAFGQRPQNTRQAMATLAINETTLRIRPRVDHSKRRLKAAGDSRGFPLLSSASLQSEVVGDSKEPAL